MKRVYLFLTLALVVAFSGFSLPAARAGGVAPVVKIAAKLTRTSEGTGQLAITADIAPGFHIYAQSQPKPFLATQFTVADQTAVRIVGPFTAARPPKVLIHPILKLEVHEHEGQVTWTAPVEFLSTTAASTVQGTVQAQACEEGRCLAPETYEFKAFLDPADADKTGATPPALGTRFSLERIETAATESTGHSVVVIFLFAFVAGFLLNLMPCVLPVVGLKLLSFVRQARASGRRVLLLNLVYSAGLLTVMLALATLAVFAGLGWGEQFSNTAFSVTLAALVFAFALSFLGVWEIPVPGFVGNIADATEGEGYTEAFSKGVLSTLLATPCSGPFLGSALAWAVAQPAYLTYAVFAVVGLGMASPYLLVGMFPRLVRFLPKPGEWMVTFKQLMGFVLLATVVFVLSFLPGPSVVPTVLVLFGAGFACWWVGRVSPVEPRGRQLRAWALAVVVIVATAWLSFGWLEGIMAERFERAAQRLLSNQAGPSGPVAVSSRTHADGIAWEPFSAQRLETLVNEGKTVFVDFTADWCLTCKANEAAAIDRPETAQLLRQNRVVALRADKTNSAPEVDATLRRLGNKAASIPYYAIFPSTSPNRPILLDGLLTSPEPVVQALRQAGASQGKQ